MALAAAIFFGIVYFWIGWILASHTWSSGSRAAAGYNYPLSKRIHWTIAMFVFWFPIAVGFFFLLGRSR